MTKVPFRVCVLTSDFPVLSETFVLAQVVGLMDRGFDVTVVSDRVSINSGFDPEAEPWRRILRNTRTRWFFGSLVHRMICVLPRTINRFAVPVLDLISDMRLNQYDAILVHFGTNGRRVARSARFGVLRRPFVTILHGVDLSQPYHQKRMAVYQAMFSTGAFFLPVNRLFRDMIVEKGADPLRCAVMPMGVDTKAIAFAARPWVVENGPTFLTVGRFVEKKGVEYALRALALVASRSPDLAWRYNVIGDGPLREKLEHLAVSLGIGGRVRFLGSLPHARVQAYLQQANLFLLPSVVSADGDMEGLPVAIMEAMAAGLTVISTRHSGIPEVISHGVNGLLAEERDTDGLAAQIEWAMRNNSECVRLALEARFTVEKQLDNTVLIDRLAVILRNLGRWQTEHVLA